MGYLRNRFKSGGQEAHVEKRMKKATDVKDRKENVWR